MKQPAAINGMMSSQKLRPQLFAVFVFSVCCLLILSVYHSVATRYGLSGICFSTARCGESRIPIKFETQHQYMNMSAEYDHLWDELLTPTGGFIDNGDGVEGTHGLSMFHQLHCLQMIRNAFQDLQRSERKKKGHHRHGQSKDDEELHPHELHWTHCLDYLRQVRKFELLKTASSLSTSEYTLYSGRNDRTL